MRLLLYNPNTDKALTEKLAAAARRRMRPSDSLKVVTSDEGTDFIGSEETISVAKRCLEGSLARHAQDCDAVLLACFGDLGVDEIRETLRLPILSLSDGFFATAPYLGKRFGIVTTSPFWADRIMEEARRRNVTQWISEIRPIGDISNKNSDILQAQCRALISEYARNARCDLVVLAGAALVGLVRELTDGSPLPIADSLAGAIAHCRAGHETLVRSATSSGSQCRPR